MGRRDQEDQRRVDDLLRRAELGGGERLQRRQHLLGKLLVRQRIALLLDPDSFTELGALVRGLETRGRPPASDAPGDGVVCGTGLICGRPVAVYAHDVTVLRGALGAAGARKIVRLLELARDQGLPVVALHDSDGVRVGEGPHALAGFAEVLGLTARLSGWVPQVGVVLGLCVGGAAYSSALQDIVIGHDETGFAFVTGAKVTRVVTGEDAPMDELGGVPMHAARTGLVTLRGQSDEACLDLARRVLTYLPQNASAPPPPGPHSDPPGRQTPGVADLLPDSHRQAYDMRLLLQEVCDRGSVLELSPDYAPNLLTCLARLAGRAVGMVASQPLVDAGCLDVDASRKGARFIQLCNAFGLPLVTLCDVPGFLPGRQQEQRGLLLHGAKLIAAYAACTVPLLTLIVRKSYGGGNVLAWPGDIRLAYPWARVQPMGAEAALAVAAHASFGGAQPEQLEGLAREFADLYDAPALAAEDGFVDRVIRPEQTRAELCRALALLAQRPHRPGLPPRKLANIPL